MEIPWLSGTVKSVSIKSIGPFETISADPHGSTGASTYTYDAVGNRLTRASTVTGISAQTFSYDANDRLLTDTTGGVATTYTYDNNGNTLSKYTSAVDQAIYEWDAQNRLVGAKVTEATGTSNIAYHYEADGIRVASIVDGTETRYLIDTVQRAVEPSTLSVWLVPVQPPPSAASR